MRTNLSAYDNSWYKPGCSVKRISWLVIHALFFNHSLAVFNGLKCALIRLYGGKVGRGVLIKPSVSIKYPWFLEIGDFVWIGEKVWIDNLTMISIGNNVSISQGAFLLTGNHNYKKVTFDLMVGGIVIENGVWIGAQATVCPGIICKSHSILTVGSVATKDLEEYSIYQGNPAIKVKVRSFEAATSKLI
jgi:putative colanic acid biosynthesis acetyltransferase WcaF